MGNGRKAPSESLLQQCKSGRAAGATFTALTSRLKARTTCINNWRHGECQGSSVQWSLRQNGSLPPCSPKTKKSTAATLKISNWMSWHSRHRTIGCLGSMGHPSLPTCVLYPIASADWIAPEWQLQQTASRLSVS